MQDLTTRLAVLFIPTYSPHRDIFLHLFCWLVLMQVMRSTSARFETMAITFLKSSKQALHRTPTLVILLELGHISLRKSAAPAWTCSRGRRHRLRENIESKDYQI